MSALVCRLPIRHMIRYHDKILDFGYSFNITDDIESEADPLQLELHF